MKNLICSITIALTLAGTLLVPAQSVYAENAPAPLRDLVTTNDNNSILTYSGSWTHNTAQTGRVMEDEHISSTTGNYVQFTFTGSTISLVVSTGANNGEADVYIDTVLQETIDLYSASDATQHIIYAKNGLTVAAHTIKVTVKGTKHASSGGYSVNIDAFRFTDAAGVVPTGTNEIACATQDAPSTTVCTQVSTQHITIVGTNEEAHADPRWTLNTAGIGNVYPRLSTVTVNWHTNPFSGSGTMYFHFDAKGEYAGNGNMNGADQQISSIGTYWPNGSGSITRSNINMTEFVSSTGNYKTGMQVWQGSTGQFSTYTLSYVLELQSVPFTSDCLQAYTAIQTWGPYVIDPTVEFPSTGAEQVASVVGGHLYMVRIGGDAWHDGATERTTAQYYIPTYDDPDGTITDFANEDCVLQTEGYYKWTAIIEIPAGGLELHVRAKDVPGGFGNNYMDAGEHFIFTISEVTVTGEISCGEQYTYDEEADWVGMASVAANVPYVEAINVELDEIPLVEGDWYVLKITGGMWQDEGDPPDRFDAQFSWGDSDDGSMNGDATWEPFGPGSEGVYCATYAGDYATIFVQAVGPVPGPRPAGSLPAAPRLWFAVNDPTGSFDLNTGALIIHIYHASFSRIPSTCELTFGIHGSLQTSQIPAEAENGETIAFASSAVMPSFGGMMLQPASWYMLETAEGPWGYVGSSTARSYGVQVKWGGQWVDLAAWSEATCNVATDSLGHRKLYFKTPESGAAAYTFRVADTSNWNNYGHMNIDLYMAYSQVSELPDGTCDYTAEEFPFITKTVQATDSTGEGLGSPISPNGLYAVKLSGSPSWAEHSGGGAKYDMQISVDNGGTWYDLPNGYDGILCYYNDGTDLWIFMHGVDVGEFSSIAFRVASETFTDNTGAMAVDVYGAVQGTSIDPNGSCLEDGQTAYVLDDYIPIDVKNEEGEYVPIQSTWLEDTNLIGFMIKIDWNGSHSWTDGETPTQHRDAALSSDNGSTWGPLDPTNAELLCSMEDEIGYASATFAVADGDKWKIRVNDVDTATFEDNGGQLAYKLYSVTTGAPLNCIVDTNNPDCIDWPSIPSGILINGIDVCDAAIIQPVAPTTIDVPAWLEYVAGWVVYTGETVMAFGAWCPRHNEALASISDMFKNREPLATLSELEALVVQIRSEAQSHNWSDTGAAPSGLGNGSASGGGDAADGATVDDIMNHILPQVTGPWAGGPLIEMTSWHGSIPYSDCVNEFGYLVPNPDLVSGLCFISANAREVGVFWFMQIMLEIASIAFLLQQFGQSLSQIAETAAGGPVTAGGSAGGDD